MRVSSCRTLPSTLEGRIQRLLLYTTVEEESWVSYCSHCTLPFTLEGRIRLLLLYTNVEEDETTALLHQCVGGVKKDSPKNQGIV